MSQPLTPEASELDLMLTEGPSSDVFRANQARGLVEAIGDNVQTVNSSTFAPSFVALQAYAIEQFVFAVTRLFEEPHKRYQLRSLPAIVEYVGSHSARLPIREPVIFERALRQLESHAPTLSGVDDVSATEVAMQILRRAMRTASADPALQALKTLRNKRLAHPEHVEAESIPRTTWESVEPLLRTAGIMVGVLGSYTSTVYLDAEAEYITSSDAAMAGMATRRVLRQLGIGKPLWYEHTGE